MNRLCTLALLLQLLWVPITVAQPEGFLFSNINSNGILGSSANAVEQRTLAGGYTLGRITITGSLTSLMANTWAKDARILVTAPDGSQTIVQPFLTQTTFTILPVNMELLHTVGTNPAGVWTFRFFEYFDNGGTGSIDARWSLTITFTNNPPLPPAATALGVLSPPGLALSAVPLSSGQVRWYQFTLPHAAIAAQGSYLDLDTYGSSLAKQGSGQYPDDTVLALFNSVGGLVASDNDSGDGFTSQLTFGAGGRPGKGDGKPYDGRHGDLQPGTYYLAVSTHPTSYANQYWGVTALGTQTGTINLALATEDGAVCYSDCEEDGDLDIFDYLCFLGSYSIQSPYADCEGDGDWDIFDFLCFLGAYGAGCP